MTSHASGAVVAPTAPVPTSHPGGIPHQPPPHVSLTEAPPRKSPSPPASICRRLSYESAQTRSQTRASSRSCSTPQPPRTTPGVPRAPASVAVSHHTTAGLPPTSPPSSTAARGGKGIVAPLGACSPGSPPTAAPHSDGGGGGNPRCTTASTPDFVAYNSSYPSPSPTAAHEPSPAAAAVKSVVPSASVDVDPARAASPFSCVLTSQTRTSGGTEDESNAITSDEKSMGLNTTPTAVVVTATAPPAPSAHSHASSVNGVTSDVQPRKPNVTVAALYTAACTPDMKQQQQQQQQSQRPRVPSPVARPHAGLAAQPAQVTAATPPPPSSPPPPQQQQQQTRRSRSASNGIRSNMACLQPAPSLSSGVGGPSPYAADRLALPRRPSPVTLHSPPSKQQQQVRPPQVQIARPSGLYRHNPALASTSMAASQLPGAAAAHNRLQLPQKPRLTRTASTAGVAAAGVASAPRRRTPSASSMSPKGSAPATASPFKRRPSSASSGVARGVKSPPPPPSTQPHQRTPSGTFTLYTTRGGGVENTGRHGVVDVAPLRSSSAPGLRRAGSNPGRAAVADTGAAVPTALRSSSNASRRLHTTAATTTTGEGLTSPSGVAGAPTSAALKERTARTRSASATRTTATTAVATGGGSDGASPKSTRALSASSTSAARGTAGNRLGDRSVRAGPVPSAVTRRAALAGGGVGGGGGTRPMISAAGPVGGAVTQRVRPVVSTTTAAGGGGSAVQPSANASPTRPSGAATRRARADRPGTTRAAAATRLDKSKATNNTTNTVSATQASMITMEESREFLEEFQRMNQRELALFGTLLTTVASEHPRPPKDRVAEVAPGARVGGAPDTEKAGTEPAITVQSAEEVSVWTRQPAAEAKPQPVEGQNANTEKNKKDTALSVDDVAAVPDVSLVDAHHDGAKEVVVLVRRSCSRPTPSATPSPSRRLDLGSSERDHSPSPRPSAPSHAHVVSKATQRQWGNENAHDNRDKAHGGSPLANAVAPSSSSSPSPASPPVRMNEPTTAAVNAAATQQAPREKRGGGVRLGGGLQQRSANDVNVNAASLSAVVRPRPSASLHPSQSRRRLRGGTAAGAGAGTAAAAPVDVHARAPHAPEQRQRSVTSYTDIRSYSRCEDHGGVDDHSALAVREYSMEGHASHTETAAEVVKAAPPLAALRRAKELAAEQAAALVQRQRERQQQQQRLKDSEGAEIDAAASRASLSLFSSCGSPTGSNSVGRPSGAARSDVAEVRMSAAQLQLLIDGSRSQQNWERYQQL